MSATLTVGQIPDANLVAKILAYIDRSHEPKGNKAARFLGRLIGISKPSDHAQKVIETWKKSTILEQMIDTLNLASVDFFLGHAAQLDGLKDSAEAIDQCRWRNLPYYIHSIWLPLAGVHADPEVVDVSGWPFQIGTTMGLQKDLEEIALKSDKGLGSKPELFDLMIRQPDDFYKAVGDGLSPDQTLRWVWYAYKFGAELAASKNMPLWQAG